MRTIIIVGDEKDRTQAGRAFWENFCWRVHHALITENLDCEVVQGELAVTIKSRESTHERKV